MTEISEDLIRQRSYEIWMRDVCPHGLAVQHWFEARSELEAERCAALLPSPDFNYYTVILARPPISKLPLKRLSKRVQQSGRSAA